MPKGVALDNSGAIYVADYHNNRIHALTNNGIFIETWGDKGEGNGQFNTPKGVAFDNSGNIYITDTGNSRVQKFLVEKTSHKLTTKSVAFVITIALASIVLKKGMPKLT